MPSFETGLRQAQSLLRMSGGEECRPLGQLNLDVDARGEIELHQSVDRLRGRLHDIEQPLVGPHLELLARLLVDVRRAVDGELLDARRKGNGTANESTRAARRVGDVAGSLIQHSMIERLQANPDVLRFHVPTDAKEPTSHSLKPRLANLTKLKSEPRDPDPQSRGWRPILLRDVRDNPCTDGAAAFANCEAKTRVHRDGSDQLDG